MSTSSTINITTPPPHSMHRCAALEMLFSAFSFSIMNLVVHALKDHLAWQVIPFMRFLPTMLIAIASARMHGVPLVFRGTKMLWARSFTGSVALLCTFYALTHMSITDTVTILQLSPLWVAVILAVFFREHTPRSTWFYIAMALCGVLIMQRPAFDGESFPFFVAMSGAMVIALAKVFLSRCHNIAPIAVVAHYTSCATLVSFFLAMTAGSHWVVHADFQPWMWLAVIPLGIGGTLGQLFMTHAYAHGNTNMVSLMGLSLIAYGAIYDYAFWGVVPDTLKVVGITIIIVAVALNVRMNAKTQAIKEPVEEGEV